MRTSISPDSLQSLICDKRFINADMNGIIRQISAGVGQKRKKKVLFVYGSKDLEDTDSDDTDYVPPEEKSSTSHSCNRPKRKTARKSTSRETNTNVTSAQGNTSLPYDVLLVVFEHLSTTDLSRASRVCSTWRDAARDPSLWRNLDLSYGNIKHCQKALTKLYEQDKLGKLTNINLSGRSDVSTQTITITSLTVEYLIGVTAVLAEVITHHHDTLQELSLCGVMHPTQGLLQAVGESSNLARLDLSHMELPAHPSLPALLEKSRHKIQILRLMKTIITARHIVDTSLSLPELMEFSAPCLDHGSIDYFIKDSVKLKSLDVRFWTIDRLIPLSSLHLPALTHLNMSNITGGSNANLQLMDWSTLKELDISWPKRYSVQPLVDEIIARGCNLEALYCAGTDITQDQIKNLLRKCGSLNTLDIGSCRNLDRGQKRLHKGTVDQLRKYYKV